MQLVRKWRSYRNGSQLVSLLLLIDFMQNTGMGYVPRVNISLDPLFELVGNSPLHSLCHFQPR